MNTLLAQTGWQDLRPKDAYERARPARSGPRVNPWFMNRQDGDGGCTGKVVHQKLVVLTPGAGMYYGQSP